ncbi:MAG: hypothetical protein ACYCPO_08750 [Acidobacteriaceae bacterium]
MRPSFVGDTGFVRLAGIERRVRGGMQRLRVRGWMVQHQKRRITAEASLCDSSGKEQAHAWGVFLVPPCPAAAARGPQE